MSEENKENKINIELPEEISEGEYANLALIAHSNAEFIVDFIRMMPGVPKAKVKSRIILTPEHAMRLYKALGDNLKRYEEAFGPIKVQNEPPRFPINFGTNVGEA